VGTSRLSLPDLTITVVLPTIFSPFATEEVYFHISESSPVRYPHHRVIAPLKKKERVPAKLRVDYCARQNRLIRLGVLHSFIDSSAGPKLDGEKIESYVLFPNVRNWTKGKKVIIQLNIEIYGFGRFSTN
jgi:hypothetical protein